MSVHPFNVAAPSPRRDLPPAGWSAAAGGISPPFDIAAANAEEDRLREAIYGGDPIHALRRRLVDGARFERIVERLAWAVIIGLAVVSYVLVAAS